MNQNEEEAIERKSLFGCKGQIHVIQDGETLYHIAKKYDVKLFELMRLNPYVNVYNLQTGDEICIPNVMSADERKYVVQQGDTLADIIDLFELPFETLVSYNPQIKDIVLQEGMVIRVPKRMPRGNVGM